MTTTPRIPGSVSTAIQQQIATGHGFDGTLPAGDAPLDLGNAIYKYTKSNAGGLFFWNSLEPLVCSQIHVSLGGSANVSVYLVNLDPASWGTSPTVLTGESMLIEQATGVTFIALDEARFKTIILPYQAIQIVTTNSSADQIAQVVASLERTFVR